MESPESMGFEEEGELGFHSIRTPVQRGEIDGAVIMVDGSEASVGSESIQSSKQLELCCLPTRAGNNPWSQHTTIKPTAG